VHPLYSNGSSGHCFKGTKQISRNDKIILLNEHFGLYLKQYSHKAIWTQRKSDSHLVIWLSEKEWLVQLSRSWVSWSSINCTVFLCLYRSIQLHEFNSVWQNFLKSVTEMCFPFLYQAHTLTRHSASAFWTPPVHLWENLCLFSGRQYDSSQQILHHLL
jgi:uncharacterized membrane protein YbaN (DUF454 family)